MHIENLCLLFPCIVPHFMNILRIDNATTCYQSARRSQAPVQCAKNTTINIHIHNDYHTCIAKISTTTLDKTTTKKGGCTYLHGYWSLYNIEEKQVIYRKRQLKYLIIHSRYQK